MAFFLLGESLELLQVFGGGLVIGAIVLLQAQRERDEMAPELIRTQSSCQTDRPDKATMNHKIETQGAL